MLEQKQTSYSEVKPKLEPVRLPDLTRKKVECKSPNFMKTHATFLSMDEKYIADPMFKTGRHSYRKSEVRDLKIKNTINMTGDMSQVLNSTTKETQAHINENYNYSSNPREYFHPNDRWNVYTENLLKFGKQLRGNKNKNKEKIKVKV